MDDAIYDNFMRATRALADLPPQPKCFELSQATLDALREKAATQLAPDAREKIRVASSVWGVPLFVNDSIPFGEVVPRDTYPEVKS